MSTLGRVEVTGEPRRAFVWWPWSVYMVHMARRTTVVLSSQDELALKEASRAEGLSQSELIRKGIRSVTAPYRRRARPLFGWLKLSPSEVADIGSDRFGDRDDEP